MTSYLRRGVFHTYFSIIASEFLIFTLKFGVEFLVGLIHIRGSLVYAIMQSETRKSRAPMRKIGRTFAMNCAHVFIMRYVYYVVRVFCGP